MHVVKTVVAATAAIAATGGITLAAAEGSGNRPDQPGRTLPTVANSHAQDHAGPVLAGHPGRGQGHAYGRGHGTGIPAGVVTGRSEDADEPGEAGEPQGPPFSVPPAHGRPTATPPVPVPSHPTGRPTSIPSHDHPAPSGPPTSVPSHSHP
jgi:hypothetical protein